MLDLKKSNGQLKSALLNLPPNLKLLANRMISFTSVLLKTSKQRCITLLGRVRSKKVQKPNSKQNRQTRKKGFKSPKPSVKGLKSAFTFKSPNVNKALYFYLIPVLAATWFTLKSEVTHEHRTILLELPSKELVNTIARPIDSKVVSVPTYEYIIQEGDNLSAIFSKFDLKYSDLMAIMKTDANYLALDTLKADNKLIFWQDVDTDNLNKMELHFSTADKVAYSRTKNDEPEFKYEDISLPGNWHTEAVTGEIRGSFSRSAKKSGLMNSETGLVVNLLKDQIDFGRDLQAGDKFEILRRTQSVDNSPTGNTEIIAVKIHTRKRVVSAYLHTDGQFYSANGESLERAFLRYPVSKKYRISSSFNPKRLHPVTNRVSPHNGTDFATPIGVPVMAAGDGTVTLTRKHPYAGNYVVIQHGNKYKTRYLHLHKVLVKKGDKVTRGERIGLAGKTGRVTGPHLHYELIAYGRPVNAMKENIPMARSVPKKDKQSFDDMKARYDKLLAAE